MNELSEIKSRDNEKLKFARRVREGKEEGLVFVEGARLSHECVRSNLEIEFGLVTPEFVDSSVFDAFKGVTGRSFFSVSEKLLGSVADTKSPQGIVLIARRPKQLAVDDLLRRLDARFPVIVYLHRVNNPSNIGAVVRTAEAAGVSGVVVSENSADPFSPKSLRASMGSAFRLPIVTNAAIGDVISSAKKDKFQTVAIDVTGTVSHTKYDWKQETLLIFGSEADGLADDILAASDHTLSIEMNNEVESLNLAVSCGIVLFEAKRQLSD